MRYYSTGHTTRDIPLSRAIRESIAPDGGIYLPQSVPLLPKAFLNNMAGMNHREIAYVIATTVLGEDIDARTVKNIVDDTLSFDMPLVDIGDGTHVLEMFHGPTLTYKDIGARFMARLLNHFRRKGERLNIMVTTTSNTGAAVAHSFSGIDGVNVYVVYPHGMMTPAQESQITVSAPNVFPIEVQGSIEDCQAMVRQALADTELQAIGTIVSMNSLNVARLLPQTFPFFNIFARMSERDIAPADYDIAIPCGNLSNLTAALLAKRMGLPCGRIIAACNTYSGLGREAVAGEAPRAHTFSRAMDSLHPFNMVRLDEMFASDRKAMERDFSVSVVDDITTARTINDTLSGSGYLIDPHTAVALAAGRRESKAPHLAVLATAHPAKSLNVMTSITGRAVDMPLQLNRFMSNRKNKHKIAPAYPALKRFLITNQQSNITR